MRDELFNQLCDAVKEAVSIDKGETPPSRVTKFSRESVEQIRKGTNKTQVEFANMIGVSVGTLRNWEQGTRKPGRAAQILLKIVAENPQAVESAAKSPLLIGN